MNLMAVDITHNSATIRWTVSSLTYDPEIYVVQYGLAMDSLTNNSAMVIGDITPVNYMEAFQGSVTLTGLNRLTTYFYRVMSTNSHGSATFSAIGTFNTSALGTIVLCITYEFLYIPCTYRISRKFGSRPQKASE